MRVERRKDSSSFPRGTNPGVGTRTGKEAGGAPVVSARAVEAVDDTRPVEQKSFYEIFATDVQPYSKMDIGKFLSDFDVAIQQLVAQPTWENLQKFKATLSSFLHTYKGELVSRRKIKAFGEKKPKVIYEMIDGKLSALINAFMAGHHDSIQWAARLEDIRGLVVNRVK